MSAIAKAGLACALALSLSACAAPAPQPIPAAPADLHALVVVDIDGTLTPDVRAIRSVRPQAAATLQHYLAKGYQVVYLSARHPWFQSGLDQWLIAQGFPAGPLHLPADGADRKAPDQYKTRVLQAYRAAGWTLAYAYGDSTTDFAAYAAAGIPREHVYALRRDSESHCLPGAWQACLEGFEAHLQALRTDLPSLSAPSGARLQDGHGG